MPRYKKKITRPMTYQELLEGFRKRESIITKMPQIEKAFLMFLFFVGCRVSEAIAVTSEDITVTKDIIYVQIHRLKGSKQTDPNEIPNEGVLKWITQQQGLIFPFSRFVGYRIVKKVFPDLYPHYFRLNRISRISDQFSDTTVYNLFGISATSIDHYRGKVDIKHVAVELKKEMEIDKK